MIMKGEGYIQWADRINQQAELANLEGIKAQDFQLMKYCQGLHETDRLYDKFMDMEVKSWATAQEIIKTTRRARLSRLNLWKVPPRTKGTL